MSKLAAQLAAAKIFVEIVPQMSPHQSPELWWKRASTREPLEKSLDKILAGEFNQKFNYLRELLAPLIENCRYCNGTGRVERGINNTVESADCMGCFYHRQVVRLLPEAYPEDSGK